MIKEQRNDNKEFLDILLKDRYLIKDSDEKNHYDMCDRVCSFLETDSRLIHEKKFVPGSSTLMAAGTRRPMMSNCFVLGVEDTLESIMEAVRRVGIITSRGGGIGYDFSNIRGINSMIHSSKKRVAMGPISVMGIIDNLTNEIKQSGKRRGANMAVLSVYHDDIWDFIKCKQKDGVLSNFNISVRVDDKFMENALTPGSNEEELFSNLIHAAWANGEPGLLFHDTINRGSRFKEHGIELTATNPCVSGDTLVAVADGRNHVPIKELAESGDNVLVHCVNPGSGESCVRMGRNPRKTRENVDVFRVKLDDGSHIDVTDNHKFLRRNGETVITKDLVAGDSLWAFNKRQDINTTRGKQYWSVCTRDFSADPGKRHSYKFEHREILKYHSGECYDGKICHHIDDNPLNNAPANLEWMTIADHNVLENARRGGLSGENNPMFGRFHSDNTKKLIANKTIERCNDSDYIKNLSDKTKAYFSTEEARKKHSDTMKDAKAHLWTTAICGQCGSNFEITKVQLSNKIDVSKTGKLYCSNNCSAKGCTKSFSKEELVSMGIECMEMTGKISQGPWLKEYNVKNPKRPSVVVIKRIFGSWDNFAAEVKSKFNHKVVSVTLIGKQDVYNITVDEFHTVSYVTNTDGVTKKLGNPKISGITTLNCGEQPLPPDGSCNLGSMALQKYVEDGEFKKAVFLKDCIEAAGILNSVIDHNEFPFQEQTDFAKEFRPIGLGVMGFHDALIKMGILYGSDECLKFIDVVGQCLKDVSNIAYKRWGNVTVTTVAPTGSVSLIGECSAGIEPIMGKTMNRSYLDNDGKTHKFVLVNECWQEHLDKGIYNEALFVGSNDVSVDDHIRVQAQWQKYIDTAISKTIIMSNDATQEDVREAYVKAWNMGCKGITVYRDGSRTGQVYTSEDTKDPAEAKSKKRPRKLPGFTYKCKVPGGSCYVNITVDENGDLIEVFSTPNVVCDEMPQVAHESMVNVEALTRIISLALKSRSVDVDKIISQLRRTKGQYMFSLPRQIADCISETIEDVGMLRACGSDDAEEKKKKCIACGEESMIYSGGCWECESCGHSRCSG